MAAQPVVGELKAHSSNVAVVAELHGNLIFGSDLRRPQDLVYDFSGLIASLTNRFVGREEIFLELEDFRVTHDRGYFEINATAGLGKTALAAEIARRYDALAFFADASRGLTRPEQFLTHIAAAAIIRAQLSYDHIPGRAGEDSLFLSRVLEQTVGKSGAPLWIVVDALDEADTPLPRANALLLPPTLPKGVFTAVLRRPTGANLVTQPGTPRGSYVMRGDAVAQGRDIERFIALSVADEPLRRALDQSRPPIEPPAFVARLKEKSQGNFMYVSYVLADVSAGDLVPSDLDALPTGLQGYYEQFWSDMQQVKNAEGWTEWAALYRPVLECLAVAMEPVTAEWLGALTGRPSEEVRERALQRWQRLLGREQHAAKEAWYVIHRSFADFLADKVDLAAAHRAVVERYLTTLRDQWQNWDDYGLRNAARHLAEEARTESSAAARHGAAERLLSLVADRDFEHEYLKRLADPWAFERNLSTAVTTASRDDSAAPWRFIEAALRLVSFRKEQRQPQLIFDLAAQGKTDAAERMLELYALEVEPSWQLALQLTIAWLAAEANCESARKLRERVIKAARLAELPALELLRQRLNAALDGTPGPTPSLPDPPTPERARALVARLNLSADDRSLMTGAEIELIPLGEGDFLSVRDGPELVSCAVNNPAVGEPMLREYIAVHAGYGYREYRQGSLWGLLHAVLRHPNAMWVRAWAPAIGAAVLAPNRGEFRENLPLSVVGLRILAGDAGATAEFDRRRQHALNAIEKLPPPAIGRRGRGDTWGLHRRRLAALAQVCSILPNSAVDDLISRALGLAFGFAGFNAPACVALADVIDVVGDIYSLESALNAAYRSAHAIQDPTFCARTTARLNALRQNWFGPHSTIDIIGAADRLVRDPAHPEFSALHQVGQYYDRPEWVAPLPADLVHGNTLQKLASVYRLPAEEFIVLNNDRGWTAESILPDGTWVRVPDLGLRYFLAARFAARALAKPDLTPDQRVRTIQMLVPIAAGDPTQLDAVLGRLLLASRTVGLDLLRVIGQLADEAAASSPPDEELAMRLTRYVP